MPDNKSQDFFFLRRQDADTVIRSAYADPEEAAEICQCAAE